MIRLQVQLSLTYLDLQHEGISSVFAGLVQRPLEDWKVPAIPNLCRSRLEQQTCSCCSHLFLSKGRGGAVDITAQDTRKQRKLVLEQMYIILPLCVMQAVDCLISAQVCQRIHNMDLNAQYLLLPAIPKPVAWLHRMTALTCNCAQLSCNVMICRV